MASVTLTTFMDFVVAAGTRKVTCVRKAKKQYGQGYDPHGLLQAAARRHH